MNTLLSSEFFQRPTLTVAQELLGKYLVRERDGEQTAFMIREVEAYDGFDDRASHAFRGKTPRTSVMFGPGGYWYVYFIYGMYYMLNIVTGYSDYPAAILIRAAGECKGPGLLTKKLNIDKSFNEKLANQKSGLWIEDRGSTPNLPILQTPRIGVSYAGEVWANKPYRFVFQTL